MNKISNTMKMLLFIFYFSLLSNSFAQSKADENLISWSATRSLTAEDFNIKTSGINAQSSAQFTISFEGGFITSGNYRKKVLNYFIKSASILDTTTNVAEVLRYQQTLFDLCEIYTRQFRKALKERKKLFFSQDVLNALNEKVMTDFANRRVQYDQETNFGQLRTKQMEWEFIIKRELRELDEFAYE